MKTCFFIGHRDASDRLRPELCDVVERHIMEYGVTEFIVGGYGNFDRLAASVVKSAKKQHPEVTLVLLLPYHPAERPIPVPDGFDSTFYLPGMERVPKRLAIVRANHYMVDNSDFLISYVWQAASNSRNLLEYAMAREKRGLIHVENLTK